MIRKFWAKEEEKVLIDLYPNTPPARLAEIFNVPIRKVYNKAFLLGIKKSEEYLQTEASGRLTSQSPIAVASRFKKGHTTWNKGMKGLQIGGKATQFKKGNEPVNTKHNGAISIREDEGRQCQFIRISKAKWRPLHNHLWESVNGPIPKGKIVVFKDKNTMNCVIENLEIIDRAENMRRNTIQRFPAEIKSAIRTISKLKKSIRNYEK
jgi:hypothetical protein